MLFISGTTANDSSAEDGNPMQQLRVVLDRITKMVVYEGGNPSDLVMLTTFVTKIDDWFPLEGEIVYIFTEFFGGQKPTNAIMEVSRLAKPSLVVEIEATVIFD